MAMAGKMSEIDMQGASGHEDARNLRNATGTRCSAWVRHLAASLFVFAALGTALPAAAQTAITLISNTGQADGDSGALSCCNHAQAFTTGANAAGYKLTGVDIEFASYTGSASYPVSIQNAEGLYVDGVLTAEPHGLIGSLTSPSSLTDTALNSYTTSGIDLAANTTYFVHVQTSSTDANSL